MRKRNRYDLPESAGVDPQGWTAGLRHFIDDRYRLVASRSFSAGLRSAAANLRRTGLPAALTVSNGGHGWILTGFEATADPLLTDEFEVTSVRVVGPLFGRQSKNGYDMPPDTKLSAERVAPLLHAVAIRPARDGLGRQVRLDAAGREGPQAAGRLGGPSGQVRARDPRDPRGGPLAVGPSRRRAVGPSRISQPPGVVRKTRRTHAVARTTSTSATAETIARVRCGEYETAPASPVSRGRPVATARHSGS